MRTQLGVLVLLLAYAYCDHIVGIPEAGPHDDEHKELFPLDITDYLGFFLGGIGLMIAAVIIIIIIPAAGHGLSGRANRVVGSVAVVYWCLCSSWSWTFILVVLFHSRISPSLAERLQTVF